MMNVLELNCPSSEMMELKSWFCVLLKSFLIHLVLRVVLSLCLLLIFAQVVLGQFWSV
jgi:hypothetical protein